MPRLLSERLFARMAGTRAMPVPVRYGITALLVLACFGVRVAVLGWVPPMPFLLFMPGIITAGLLFDRGTGLFATAASALLGIIYFLPPSGVLQVGGAAQAVEVMTFLSVGIFTAVVLEALHRAISRLAAERASLAEANARLRATSSQVGTLLSESVHRARNDLQRLAATLRLKAGMAQDAAVRDALQDASGRIAALARINGRLDRHREEDGRAEVESRGFLQGLVADLEDAAVDMRPVALSVQAQSTMLPMSRAVPIGLIVNELVGNALKYAFPAEDSGSIAIGFRRDGANFVLTVEDDGVGCDLGAPAQGSGLGTRISRALAGQLGGRIEAAPVTPGADRPGLRWTISFPRG
ncbi:sensor histidine kinase [Falsiroseomonas sp. E2-1-a20]|uniref:sensor histidine kinase n=1 Tax=Falsiroseomonas sp. E2-1-a20 TaxID=3239300 RepID=UPI003F3E8648